MIASDVDALRTRDLAALGEDSKRDPLPMTATLRAGVYRDDRPSATARREALLAVRHHELALMPLALSQLFVHRVARAVAGGAAIACAALFVLVLADPLLFRIASYWAPGLNVTACAALVVGAILAAYVVGGWIAERVFAKRMREAIATGGDDVHADLDRLAEGPLAIGHKLVDRADGWAIGLSLAGTIAIVTVFGFNAFVLVSSASQSQPWSFSAFLSGVPVAHNVAALGVGIGVGLVGAYVIARGCELEQRRDVLPPWARFDTWKVPVAGALVGIATLYSGTHSIYELQHVHALPSFAWRLGHVCMAVASVFFLASFVLLRLRRREMNRLV